MFNISNDTLSTAVPRFRDAILSLFIATATLGLADHLITGPHIHTIATGVVMYLATAGLTLIGGANLVLGVKAVRS
jgi:hypothetical protein